MKQVIILLFLFIVIHAESQEYIVAGQILDTQTGKPVSNVTIKAINSNLQTLSDSIGKFRIKLYEKTSITATKPNYQDTIIDITQTKDTTITIYLLSKDINIETVKVVAEKENITCNKIALSGQKILSIPAIAGEPDILKALQLTPGVQNSGENSVGLNIRGGDNSQNLFLFDGVELFNPSHLFGFVSVFNVDEIDKVNFYKGGFPAYYGGKTSSIIDIKLKNGARDKLHGKINIGLVSSKLFFQGPISKKTTFIFSARSTYANSFLKLRSILFKPRYEHLKNIGFYETNYKITHYFSNSFSISIGTFYNSDFYVYGKNNMDSLSFEKYKEEIKWSNFLNYFKLSKNFDDKFEINFLLANTNYNSKILTEIDYYDADINDKYYNTNIVYSAIKNNSAKLNFKINTRIFNVDIGSQFYSHAFAPTLKNFVRKNDFLNFNYSDIPTLISYNLDIYANSYIKIRNKLFFNFGIRLPYFFTEDKIFKNFEHRISAAFKINKYNTLKFSTTKMSQFSFLLSNYSLGLPVDVWVPATPKTNFLSSFQNSISFNSQIQEKFAVNIDAYYKTMNNLIDFKDNISMPDYSNYENLIETQGIGKAYGVEMLLQKKTGKTTFWVSYTYSRSFRKFNNINQGNWYPFKYDRPHNFACSGTHKIRKNIELGFVWIFYSGYAITMPTGIFPAPENNEMYVFYYEGRNANRMPNYHRLDLNLKIQQKSHTISFDIYNAYNHLNAYYIFLQKNTMNNNFGYSVWKRTLFPIIPSISYSLKF